MGLKWAMSYKFDEEADSYVLTNPDEEIDEEQNQLEGQAMFPTYDRFNDDDLDDLEDDPSE
jgi:hypothetical protein